MDSAGGAQRELANVTKCPDESWGATTKEYITFAVEVGVSEGEHALESDAKIWLEQSESHVTQVVTIKISRTRPKVLFSLWVTDERDTRAGHPQRATTAQEVFVVLEKGQPATEGSLCISFEKLFDRRP